MTDFDADEPNHHALGRSRGGLGTKLHLICDGQGVPLSALLLPGQAHESTQFEALVDTVAIKRRTTGRLRRRPKRLAADRAYHARRIRQWLHRQAIQAVIPPRASRAKPRPGRPISYSQEHYLSCPQCHRTLRRLAQGVPLGRDPLREARRQLSSDGQAGLYRTLSAPSGALADCQTEPSDATRVTDRPPWCLVEGYGNELTQFQASRLPSAGTISCSEGSAFSEHRYKTMSCC